MDIQTQSAGFTSSQFRNLKDTQDGIKSQKTQNKNSSSKQQTKHKDVLNKFPVIEYQVQISSTIYWKEFNKNLFELNTKFGFNTIVQIVNLTELNTVGKKFEKGEASNMANEMDIENSLKTKVTFTYDADFSGIPQQELKKFKNEIMAVYYSECSDLAKEINKYLTQKIKIKKEQFKFDSHPGQYNGTTITDTKKNVTNFTSYRGMEY